MAVDIDEERINTVLPYVTNAQIGDSTNEEFLASLGMAITIPVLLPLEITSKTLWKPLIC